VVRGFTVMHQKPITPMSSNVLADGGKYRPNRRPIDYPR